MPPLPFIYYFSYEKYHVTYTMIATDDFGEPFYWGYSGFNVSVRRIRVIKAVVYRKYIE